MTEVHRSQEETRTGTNLECAKRIKAIADEKFPSLIIGIFHAKGNYNQDLGPRMILLEFGTHTTTLEEAKRSTALMAQVIPAAAGMRAGNKEGCRPSDRWRSIGHRLVDFGHLNRRRCGLGLD